MESTDYKTESRLHYKRSMMYVEKRKDYNIDCNILKG